MARKPIPGSADFAMAVQDRGGLPDNWTFQGLLRDYLETIHPDPQAQGRTRAEILVQAIFQGAIKQAMSGTSRADVLKLLVDEVGKVNLNQQSGRGDSLTDVEFLIVDPAGESVVIEGSVTGGAIAVPASPTEG